MLEQATFSPGSRQAASSLQYGTGLWLDGAPKASSDERFILALDGGAEMERCLRLVYGYGGCIFSSDQRCPHDAPVTCAGCRG